MKNIFNLPFLLLLLGATVAHANIIGNGGGDVQNGNYMPPGPFVYNCINPETGINFGVYETGAGLVSSITQAYGGDNGNGGMVRYHLLKEAPVKHTAFGNYVGQGVELKFVEISGDGWNKSKLIADLGGVGSELSVTVYCMEQ